MSDAPAAPRGELDYSPRLLVRMSIPALVVGVVCASMLQLIDVIAEALEGVIWDTVPESLGLGHDTWWWTILVLTVTGIAVGLTIRFMPGHAGPDSAETEMVERPLPLIHLPGVALALVLGLAGGVSLGPENPIIAINVALMVALFTRFFPIIPTSFTITLAAAGTIGAMFGTPIAAALAFTATLAVMKGGGSLWDKMFLPLVAGGAGAITMHLFGVPPMSFGLPAYEDPAAIDLLSGAVVAIMATLIAMVALALFPWTHRAFHALRHPVLIPAVGGLVLGILGAIGGEVTLFKGAAQMGELLANRGEYDAGELALIVGIKVLALLVSAGASFRGGRVFPATFIGVAIGLLATVLVPSIPLTVAVACGVLGVVLVVARDGWIALFMGAVVAGDTTIIPILCVVILPIWLMVSRAKEFRIIPARSAVVGPL